MLKWRVFFLQSCPVEVHTFKVTIDNRGNPTYAATTLSIPESRADLSKEDLSEIAKTFVVQGQSNVRILGGHSGLTFDHITVKEMSYIQFGQHKDVLRIRYIHNAHFS